MIVVPLQVDFGYGNTYASDQNFPLVLLRLINVHKTYGFPRLVKAIIQIPNKGFNIVLHRKEGKFVTLFKEVTVTSKMVKGGKEIIYIANLLKSYKGIGVCKNLDTGIYIQASNGLKELLDLGLYKVISHFGNEYLVERNYHENE